jgi:hypothetical protein
VTGVRVTGVAEADRPRRYLDQLVAHASAMARGHGAAAHAAGGGPAVTVTDAGATLDFPGLGSCTATAAADVLLLDVEAADATAAGQIQSILTADLERFGRRDRLAVRWDPVSASA